MFNELKKELKKSFNLIAKNPLYVVTTDRDEIWEQYISGFHDETRQEHNCNACKSFLRQFGNIVAIVDNKIVSIWDNIAVPEEYATAIQNLREYIHSLNIRDIFINDFAKCGVDKNLDKESGIVWQHFFIELPREYVANKNNIDTFRGQARDSKNVLKRGLDELTLDSTETVLELIAQDSIYRGKEFEGIVKEFQKLQKQYSKLKNDQEKNNFCWVTSRTSQAVSRIRNTAIGTLLIDLSEGMELDSAVAKFERVVAPANYKRTSAAVTPRMIAQAKDKLTELGLLESLNRRFANEADISTNDVIYRFKPSKISDVFEQISGETLVNPKTLSKVEEISIGDFVEKIVPTAKSIAVLPENSHLNNFVSLLTAENGESPSLFKWGNHFSWSYTGGVTDGIKERVKNAGGNVNGVLRFSIQWNDAGNNDIDFDAHALEPNGTEIYYSTFKKPRKSPLSGQLDIDIISPGREVAVENIVWDSLSAMKDGTYRLWVHNFSGRTSKGGFTAQVEFNGETYDFEYGKNLRGNEDVYVAEVNYSKFSGFSIKTLIDSKSSITSKQKWGISTNQFQKVTKIMLSPNHWVGTPRIGNKHYFFFLENCRADEAPRPFYNEFLKPELDQHRKVFEVLGGKIKVEETPNQLSGLGFSETQRNHLFVQIEGKFKRTLKVNF
ncbi:MAG TPA: hypothetical protein PLP33_24880 [Leptospiraceae bacterium]|nr:hypothetical protein [Leptospiraceae bacterium]